MIRLRWFYALCPLLLSGCYTTTLTRGAPAANARFEYDERWHHGMVVGIAELSGPYNLARVCPSGWAEIKTETSFLNGVVEAATSGIYSPQTVTVRCAAAPSGFAPGEAPEQHPKLPPPPMAPPEASPPPVAAKSSPR